MNRGALGVFIAAVMALLFFQDTSTTDLAWMSMLLGVTVTIANSMSGAGGSISSSISRSADGAINYDPPLNLGYAGTLSTRTSDTAGTLTVLTGHTIVTGDLFDIHWESGGVKYVAYGCLAGTVSAPTGDTSIPFTSAAGDVLPIATTAVTFVEQKQVNTVIDGDNVKALGIIVETTDRSLRKGAHIEFFDVGNAQICEIDLVTNVLRQWDIEGGDTNPFTGNPITYCLASANNQDSAQTVTLKIIGVQDITP